MLLTYCGMLVVGFGPVIAQGTQSNRPQAERLKRALCYHGIEGRNSEAVVTLLAHTLLVLPTPEATVVEHQRVRERSTEAVAHALRTARW